MKSRRLRLEEAHTVTAPSALARAIVASHSACRSCATAGSERDSSAAVVDKTNPRLVIMSSPNPATNGEGGPTLYKRLGQPTVRGNRARLCRRLEVLGLACAS